MGVGNLESGMPRQDDRKSRLLYFMLCASGSLRVLASARRRK